MTESNLYEIHQIRPKRLHRRLKKVKISICPGKIKQFNAPNIGLKHSRTPFQSCARRLILRRSQMLSRHQVHQI